MAGDAPTPQFPKFAFKLAQLLCRIKCLFVEKFRISKLDRKQCVGVLCHVTRDCRESKAKSFLRKVIASLVNFWGQIGGGIVAFNFLGNRIM